MGSLTGTTVASSADINLSVPPQIDWSWWALSINDWTKPVTKNGGGNSISIPYLLDAANTTEVTTNTFPDAREVTFTDGTPPNTVVSGYSDFIVVSPNTAAAPGQGIGFTLPASESPLEMRLWWFVTSGAGKITAHLSDSSASDYTVTTEDTGADNTNTYLTTLTFAASSSAQTLTVGISLATVDDDVGTFGFVGMHAVAYAAGTISPTGTLASTVGNAIAALTGAVSSVVTGSFSATLGNAVLENWTGAQSIKGSFAATLNDAAAAAEAREEFVGTLSSTLPDIRLTAVGTETFAGTLANLLLADAALNAEGFQGVSGSFATTLGNTVLNASARETFAGTLGVTLDDADLSATGEQLVRGRISAVLDNVALSGSAVEEFSGHLASTLAGASAAFDAVETFSGAMASSLDGAVMQMEGATYIPKGSLESVLSNASMRMAGVVQEIVNAQEAGYYIVLHRRTHER